MKNQLETMSSESGRSEGEAKTAIDLRRCSIAFGELLKSRENAR
jgi:hypothetical protein